MSQNTVQINITADVIEAQAELKSLQKQLQELVSIQNDSLNKFDERTDQFQEHINTSIEKVKGNIDQVIGKIEEFKGQDIGTKLQVSLNNTSSALSSFGNMVKTAFVYDVAFQAINKLEDALEELAKQTLEVDSRFEQLKVGIAGQLSANLSFISGTKKVTDEQANFNVAMGESAKVFNKLRQASATTGVPLEELAKGFMGASGPAFRMGMSIDQLTSFVEKMATVAKATSIPMNMLGREIKDLMMGQRSQLTLEMGVTEAWISQHKAAGDLAQAYMDMANKYQPMIAAQGQTWEATKTKVLIQIQNIENAASKDIFSKLKDSGIKLQKALEDNASIITVKLKGAFDDVSSSIEFLVKNFNTLLEAFKIITVGVLAMKAYQMVVKGAIALQTLFNLVVSRNLYVIAGIAIVSAVEGVAYWIGKAKDNQDELNASAEEYKKKQAETKASFDATPQGKVSNMKAQMQSDILQLANLEKAKTNVFQHAGEERAKVFDLSIARYKAKIKEEQALLSNSTFLETGEAPIPAVPTPVNRNPEDEKKPKGLSNELQLLEEELNKKKIIHEQSIQDEIGFWKSKLKPSQEGLAIYSDIVGKIASLTERQRSEEKSKQQSNIQIIESGLAESKALGTLKVADEVSIWESYLNSVNKGSKEYLAVLNKFNEAKKRLDEENYKNAMQSLSKEETEALATLEYKHTMNTESLSGSKRDNDQKIAEEISFQNKMFSLKMSFLQRELSLAGKDDSKVSATNNNIEALTRSHNVTMNKLDVQAATERDKVWQQSQSIVENSFGTAINDVIMKTKTLGQAFRSMFSSILSGLAGMLAQWAAHWVAQHAIDLIATKTATTAKVGIEAAANTTIGIEATTAATTAQAAQAPTKTAQATGLVAMATMGSFASQAAIPVAGPALAAKAAAATTAILSPMIAVASASGGYDIPNGVNPMTQLHQNEMVLPAHIAQPLRDSLKGGGVGGGHTYNINVQAMDARGVKSFMMDNQDALVSAMKSAHRNSMR